MARVMRGGRSSWDAPINGEQSQVEAMGIQRIQNKEKLYGQLLSD